MMVLLQILKQLTTKQQELFVALFTEWVDEANDLGYASDSELADFANDCMFNHFGFQVEDSGQLERLVTVLKNPESVKAALAVVKMK
jgi:hypothetical protein